MSDEQLNKILMKADDDLQALKDRCHDLYEENERLKQANKILEENWLHYMKCCEKAIEYIKKHSNSFSVLDTISNSDLLNILQNERNKGR